MENWVVQKRNGTGSPYVHWWVNSDRGPNTALRERGFDIANKIFGFEGREKHTAKSSTSSGDSLRSRLPAPIPNDPPDLGSDKGDFVGDRGLPYYARNPEFDISKMDVAKIAKQIGEVDKNTVIVGIIDDGIALGHSRFQRRLSKKRVGTRFLAAWLQGAAHESNQSQPFGRVITERQIEQAIAAHTYDGWLDEDGFNRTIDPAPPEGPKISDGARRLMGAMSHGTHVLDLATGGDPNKDDPKLLERQRIIAVNLPSREVIGMAGTFLEFYVSHAMEWITAVADELWKQRFGKKDPRGGFPVVFNLSYGQQAGTKTGTSHIEQTFRKLQTDRQHRGNLSAPLRLAMPVGNDNLAQCNIRRAVKYGDELKASWRIQPQDQSSNFVEIWVDLHACEVPEKDSEFPLSISVSAPSEKSLDKYTGRDGEICDHPDGYLRIYADVVDVADLSDAALFDHAAQNLTGVPTSGKRIRYLIAMRPTLDHRRPEFTARSGVWKVDLSWNDTAMFSAQQVKLGRNVYMNVQVDQEPAPWSNTNRRSYFDSERYIRFLPSGRPLDSYSYLAREKDIAGSDENQEPANHFFPVQRKGTHNSLANHDEVLVIGGHRESDGRPAYFSATALPESQMSRVASENIASVPTASFPVDVSPTQIGVRAAGTKSGSVGSLRGTSFAAPQATRWIVAQLIAAQDAGSSQDHPDLQNIGTRKELLAAAKAADAASVQQGSYPNEAVRAKVGGGRMPSPLDVTSRGRLQDVKT